MNPVVISILALSLVLGSCRSLSALPAPGSQPGSTLVVSTLANATPQADAPRGDTLASSHSFDGGWYQLYFTDPTAATARQLTGGPDTPLVAAIDAAHLSVDAALYSLSLKSIQQSLLRAHRRGLNVRLVMESDNMDQSVPEVLKEAGIPILGDRREGLMHNKFVVIDRSEVWTGSMNLTTYGTYADRNNLLRISSTQVAQDYETEFDEMFVDDKFGPDVVAATPFPRVVVEGTQLDVYFSPDDRVQAALLGLLDNAQRSIDFLAYSFTADPLSKAIQRRAAAGVSVSGVMDAEQVDTNIGTEYEAFRGAGIDVRLDGEGGLMHHKVMIIDDEIVVLGSYNFTASAEKYNDENLIVVHSPTMAAQYLAEFRRIYAAAAP